MNARPTNYLLEFEPDLEGFVFRGRETITITCDRPTSVLSLHAAELRITKSSVTVGGKTHTVKTALDAKSETLRVTLGRKIRGRILLHLEFSGTLNDRLLGFYRSKYRYKNKTKYLATTQFEAADARRAFPCWDEPDAKATFDISVITRGRNTALSNMPAVSKKRTAGGTLYTFARTPVMSTYLVYLGVGEFEFLRGRRGKITVRVVTTRGNKSRGRYALELGKKLIGEYEDYFGIKYPLPKLDLIAIPDFAAGAMENWGAITFRETILLYDPQTSSTGTKQLIAEVISHEIAHQWFGNLVTMKWWNDLWLNESFATFMATKFVDRFYPDWDMWDQFIEDAMNTAMNLDALKSTHPIDVNVREPSEIREIFDAISYDKGGCILRMLENFVTEAGFKRGLRRYLKKFKYKNARGADLWDAIGRVAGLDVKSIIDTWIGQAGYPVLEAKRRGSRLKLEQRRFFSEQTGTIPRQRWSIPVSVRSGGTRHKKLLTGRAGTMPLGGRDYTVNDGRHGFYRVKYDRDALLDLKYAVRRKTMPHADRWAVQNDLYALCIAGEESLRRYLDFSEAYAGETNYLVSTNVARNLHSLQFRTHGEPYAGEIGDRTRRHFEGIFGRLGWDAQRGERHTDALLRGFAITVLGKLGDSAVIAEAESRFKEFLKNPGSLSADLRESVYGLVAWNGGARTHARLVSLYRNADSQEEKMRLLGALCSFKDEKLLLRTLEFSQTDEVRSQNMQLPIMRIAANPYGRKILWPWLKRNWKKIGKKIGHGNPLLNRIVASLSLVADRNMEGQIRRFFSDNPAPGTERTLEQTLERVRINGDFLDRARREF